ncbi:uracil-DNA glycosylase [uncultured Nocardioides sp.]|uniref:uracil-DNA glycosylase n=1 Tax=uncultured Nocardioides sp. TaxID=198441 RepID=UPI0026197FB7|nr:uracil-DNA glycosylase [uncultured Nocardioides sp.]
MRFVSPVPPGTGWPGDLADDATPVARTPAAVRRVAAAAVRTGGAAGLADLDAAATVCRACPRLVDWREEVAATKRASYVDEPYFGRPLAGMGPLDARIVVVGLAPAAQGGNRTGRIFTGDRSADWLHAALHRSGMATQATSLHAGDGQELLGVRMTMGVRCAPPANKPTTAERDTCAPWITAELRLMPAVRVVVALGSFGWDVALRTLRDLGHEVPRPRPRFGHAAEALLPAPRAGSGDGRPDVLLVGCFHPSQQNTFTGRLTEQMLDAVLARAREVAGP